MRSLILGLVALGLSACSCNQDTPVENPEEAALDPGRVVLHRLNRAEYNNTVQDLLGTQLTPADDFPWDDTSHGFDNIAETLTMSPLHVELYEKAAETLATEALLVPVTEPELTRLEGESEDVTATTGGSSGDNWNLWSAGDLYANIEAPQDGLYALRARVWADQAGPDLAQAVLSVDGAVIETFDIVADSSNNPEIIEVEVDINAGTHIIAVGFINDYYEPDLGLDRNLHVDWIEFEGPLNAEALENPIRDALLVCDPETTGERACAQLVLEAFAPRAWRRPVTEEELANLMSLYDTIVEDEGTFDDGLRLCVQAVLLSPHFLFRVEVDPVPGNPVTAPLTSYELASRLSYFLWSSMPDDALFDAAANNELQTDEQIAEQVRRMLADPKSEALVDNLAGQWLYLRAIEDKAPDPWTFPEFDEDLRDSMHEEMTRFFRSFIHEDRDLTELLTAQQGEIDARLAEHYGVDGVTEWTEVDLAALDRGGLLGHAGLLMVNSYPARTSPVLRGKWVLSNLLCSEPPPPPAGVEGLIEDDAEAQSIRDALEQHRADPVCASCHDVMDPIGLGMEHFNGIGAYRDEDNGFLVDASGELPDGTSFYGVRELSEVIAADDRLVPCIAEKTFTYALGRSPNADDAEVIQKIPAAADGLTFEELAVHIATSLPFRYRTGEAQ